METSLKAMDLGHAIDPNHVPECADLDKKQNAWLYKTFQDKLVEPTARSIVTKHLVDQNCRDIWKELCDTFSRSQVASVKAGTISGCMTGTKLATANWRGTNANWLLHYNEQCRLCAKIAPQDCTDEQKIEFLNNAVAGVPGLCNVLTLNRQVQSGSGVTTPLSFADYLQLLLD